MAGRQDDAPATRQRAKQGTETHPVTGDPIPDLTYPGEGGDLQGNGPMKGTGEQIPAREARDRARAGQEQQGQNATSDLPDDPNRRG